MVYACLHIYVHGGLYINVEARGRCSVSFLITLYKVFSEPRIHQFSWIDGQKIPEILLSLPPHHWAYCHRPPCQAFSVGSRNGNSGLHACTISRSLAEFSPQPCMLIQYAYVLQSKEILDTLVFLEMSKRVLKVVTWLNIYFSGELER